MVEGSLGKALESGYVGQFFGCRMTEVTRHFVHPNKQTVRAKRRNRHKCYYTYKDVS